MIGTQPADRSDLRSAYLCSGAMRSAYLCSGAMWSVYLCSRAMRSTDFVVGDETLATFESLKSRRQFLAVARTGARAVRPGLILQAGDKHGEGPEPQKSTLRIGFTVSRKVGNAVERNLVKRRFRELARRTLAERADPARDYVLVGRKAAVKRPYGLLQKDLEQALRDLKLEKKQ